MCVTWDTVFPSPLGPFNSPESLGTNLGMARRNRWSSFSTGRVDTRHPVFLGTFSRGAGPPDARPYRGKGPGLVSATEGFLRSGGLVPSLGGGGEEVTRVDSRRGWGCRGLDLWAPDPLSTQPLALSRRFSSLVARQRAPAGERRAGQRRGGDS